MPLIIITGLPCSGKSHRAQQIATSLSTFIASSTNAAILKRTVQIVPSHHACSDLDSGLHVLHHSDTGTLSTTRRNSDLSSISFRDEIYTSAALEKTARAAEFSAIKRALSKDNIVISDGLNYIKGYRYQLWCEAKAAGTRCCVVHVAAREEECQIWNRERLGSWGMEGHDDMNLSGEQRGDQKDAASKQGENTLGELMPESHTDLYGDRRIEKDSGRSRSSWMDGSKGNGADIHDDVPRIRPADDTMTLTSLYITSRLDGPSSTQPLPAASSLSTSQPRPPIPNPSIPLPLPTSSPPYKPSTLTSLTMRYEPPSPFSRWDTPLFTLPSTDSVPPIQDIWNALYPPAPKPTSKKALSQLSVQARSTTTNGHSNTTETGTTAEEEDVAEKGKEEEGAMVKPHAATILPRATSSDALQTLESATMDVVKHLLAQSRSRAPSTLTGGEGRDGSISLSIPIPNSEEPPVETAIHIPSSVTLSQPMLQRLRRKYTQIQRGGIAHGQGYVVGRRKIVEGFMTFLEEEFDDDD